MFSFFTNVFRVFLLLIAFFHVTNFLYPDCFLRLFSCCTASATNFRELFILSIVFYFTLLLGICHNLLLSRLGSSSPWRLQGLVLRLETQTRPAASVCLNHTMFSKRQNSLGYLYVLCYNGTLYQPLPLLNLLFNNYIYCKVHSYSLCHKSSYWILIYKRI